MAAPEGNKFWELRNQHGREKLFATPDLMWEAACEYFEWCKDNPILKKDWVGKDADAVYRELDRPFTLSGLCIYLECGINYFNQFSDRISGSTKQIDKDFSLIITRIREVIETQQFEGAAVGIFNANIIARKLGLSDKQDHTTNGKDMPGTSIDASTLSTETLEELLKAGSNGK